MTPNEFQKACLRTEKTPTFVEHAASDLQGNPVLNHELSRIIHGMVGIATEAGELQDMVKKALIYGKPIDRTNVMEECFDVLWYVALCLDAAGFTMETAMERGLAKLRIRFPDGFSQESATSRDAAKERIELETR
jgi:NTP pyrophosphatase (non-canonical NTP hydrolase)